MREYGDSSDFFKFLLEHDYSVHYETNEENRLIFLAYCSKFQKELAGHFGSVMFFYTIVQTNKYNMVRGTLSIQLNNGRISPIVHCLLANQEKQTFIKFFEITFFNWIKPPGCILTDQDKAIIGAIRYCLKDLSHHVYCNRHAIENAQKNISSLLSVDSFKDIGAEKKFRSIQKLWGYLILFQRKKH